MIGGIMAPEDAFTTTHALFEVGHHDFGADCKHFIAPESRDLAFWFGISTASVWLFTIFYIVNLGAKDALTAMKSMGFNRFKDATLSDWASQTPMATRILLFGAFYTFSFLTLWFGHGHPYNLVAYSSPLFQTCSWTGFVSIVCLCLSHAFSHLELADWVKNAGAAVWSGEWSTLFLTTGFATAFIFEALYTYLYSYCSFSGGDCGNYWMAIYFLVSLAVCAFGCVSRFAAAYFPDNVRQSLFPLGNWCESFGLMMFTLGIGISAYVLKEHTADTRHTDEFHEAYYNKNPDF